MSSHGIRVIKGFYVRQLYSATFRTCGLCLRSHKLINKRHQKTNSNKGKTVSNTGRISMRLSYFIPCQR